MSDDVVKRYNGARPIQAPAQLLADAIHEIEVLREENARLQGLLREAHVKMEANNLWSNLRHRVAAAIREGERMPNIPKELAYLCTPHAERLSDFDRINEFCRVGREAVKLLGEQAAEIERLEQERNALREENARLLAANKDLQLHFDVVIEDLKEAEEENAGLREQINSAYDKGRGSLGKVVVAGHALFVYAQKMTHKIKHHSLEKLFPLPDGELLAFIEAVNESSNSERARAAIREGRKDD